MKKEEFYISHLEDICEVDQHLIELDYESGYCYKVTVERVKNGRTGQQNKAMHKYFTLLAIALNDAGYDMRRLLKEEIDIPWRDVTIKDDLWRPIQIAVVGKESTSDLDTDEPSKVFNVLSRHLSEKTGVYVPFPSYR
jgi:hypothetical protein